MKRFTSYALLLAIVGLTAAPHANAAERSSLTVTISGLRNQKGQVCLSLFSEGQGFPGSSDRAIESQCVSVISTETAVTFRNLNAGSYAVAVIHDANKDGTLNKGFLGIPKEGFGFSRNPRIRIGPPSFRDAAISVSGTSTNIMIQLKYL
ncbi:DUF2141 domain-containing protein [Leptolyngbya sp. FACHB-36]|uniref:DUF2141 domain-containing protein n=1 Tax=Leptolyngbya sp. FACHB-36 TaxID=2692808 RepID=UPI0016819ED4|nr:DUF2141 domain-containing protein [Leptolyngbya sp. FACHB-36]MBD2022228.1 DUF2141 domain-containing protein [Leptolyngbya sp. FACHB-36]